MSGPVAPTGWWRPISRPATAVSPDRTEISTSSRIAFGALIVFTVILILAPQDHLSVLKPLHLAMLSGMVAGGAYLAGRFAGRIPPAPHSPEVVYAALLLALAVATVPFSLWPGGSLGRISSLFIKALIIFWLLGRVVDSVPRLRMIAWTLSLIAIPLSLGAVTTFLSDRIGNNVDLTYGWHRIVGYGGGLTENPNDLALTINLTIPFTVALMIIARRHVVRLAMGILVALDIGAVIATYSRGGSLTLMTIGVSYLICLPRRARAAMVALALVFGIAMLPVIPQGYWHRLSTIVNPQSDKTGSAQQRIGNMIDAVHYVEGHPLVGAGVGMNILALRDVGSHNWEEVHDVYLQYAVSLGLPGLVIFLALYYQALKSARFGKITAAEKNGNKDLYHLSEATFIALTAFAVSAIFHPVAYQFYFYYIAGLAVATRRIAIRRCDRQAPAGR